MLANIHTLQNIKGHRLGSICEEELEKKYMTLSSPKQKLISLIQKLRTHALQVINEHKQIQNENTNLISHNAQKDIFIAESKAENVTKSKKIKSLEFIIKILESKLSSAQKDVISIQNDSSKKESEILSLKSKIVEVEHELASKVSELEYLKSEAISNPILGGNDEKNMTKKSMDQAKKIDNDISAQTSTFGTCFVNDEISELPKIDTEVNSEVKDRTSISKINKDNILDISIKPNTSQIISENVTPHLIQPDNNISALIESNSQMRPCPEALPLPAVASTLMSPLSAYIFLALLIIAVVWFVVLKCELSISKKK
ncbi:hypothetical protein C2G38_2230974 [Gigaspora rosea]|uniref:Uncharacterized protein n=1 Tax=Gigaspora rosea TaxID=44941 RepID=A0A397TTC8_9GLOM|nr:hypothetical protein C2G38_2230974 [Gigaspora rosea]